MDYQFSRPGGFSTNNTSSPQYQPVPGSLNANSAIEQALQDVKGTSYPSLKARLFSIDNAIMLKVSTVNNVAPDANGNVNVSADWKQITGKPTFAAVATSGSYTDLMNKPLFSPVAMSGNYLDLTGRPTLASVAMSGSYADLLNKPTYAAVATSGSYADLSGKPILALVATSGSYADLTGKPILATVANTGSYNDLLNKPTIPTVPTLAPVATSGLYSDLTGKPTLATVATSGNYNDLSNRPVLATVATSGSYNDLSNKPAAYALPNASDTVLGGVKVGLGLTIDALGVLKTGRIIYSVKGIQYGAKGDGTTNDTTAIQNCFNACSANGDGFVYFPKGTYMVDATVSINMPSNIRIVFDPQAVIKVIPNSATSYNVFKIIGVSNVFIEGNGASILGDRATHTVAPAWQANHAYLVNDQVNANGIILKCTTAGTSSATMPTGQGTAVNDGTVVWAYVYSGEAGMGLYIVGSSNVFISNLTAKGLWGDGFYIGGGTASDNIYLNNCIGDNNRRQGLSITNVKNMTVIGGEYKNTVGTDPQYGIDIEPNNGSTIQNVNLLSVSTSSNFGGGLQLCPMFMTGTNPYNVNVQGFTSENELGGGIDLVGGSPFPASEVYGKINIKDAFINNPVSTGMYVQGWRNMPRVDVANVTVLNPNAQNSTNLQLSSGFVVYASPNDAAGNYGNIKFENCGVIDNRATSQTYAPFFIASDATHTVQNISIIDPFWEGIKPTLKGWIESTGNFFGNAKFTNPSMVNISTSQSIYAYLGQELVATAALTATLPSSNASVGNEFTIRYGASTGTVTIALAAGDSLIHKGASVTTLALTVPGTFAKVRAIGGNKYTVVEHNVA